MSSFDVVLERKKVKEEKIRKENAAKVCHGNVCK